MSIFKACDIRGVVGQEWDTGVARKIGRSLGNMIHRRGGGPVCVGGDFRSSTPSLKQALLDGLLAAGAKIQDVGQQPTPVVYCAARQLGCRHVAIVTASHNAGKYNGVKFMVAGQPALPALIEELRAGLDSEGLVDSPGFVERADPLAAYESRVVNDAMTFVRCTPGNPRRLRIVVDTMAGAFTSIAPRVLRAAGFEVTSLVDELDPQFKQRHPNPAVDANLADLIGAVRTSGADLGVGLDGDGDRAGLVDHTGAVIRPEQIGAFLVEHCLSRPTVVYDLKCASILARSVQRAGGTCVMQPSGHGFIKTTMLERQADLGVEVSGHYFFRALDGGDDGLFVALVLAFLLSRLNEPLTQMIERIGWPAITPDLRVPFQGDGTVLLEQIASRCGGEICTLDGVRAQYEDGWGLARMSITEPLITMRFEGRTHACLSDVAGRFLCGVPELLAQVKETLDDGRPG